MARMIEILYLLKHKLSKDIILYILDYNADYNDQLKKIFYEMKPLFYSCLYENKFYTYQHHPYTKISSICISCWKYNKSEYKKIKNKDIITT